MSGSGVYRVHLHLAARLHVSVLSLFAVLAVRHLRAVEMAVRNEAGTVVPQAQQASARGHTL